MKITRSAKLYLVLALLLVVGMLIVWYMAVRYINKQGIILVDQTTSVADRAAHDQAYQRMQAMIATSSSEQTALMSRVLTEDKTITFLTTIENDAAAFGVKLVTDSIQQNSTKSSLDALVVMIDLSGPQAGVRQVIAMLETLPYYGSIDSLTYSSGNIITKTDTTANLKLTLGLLKPTK